MTLTAAVIGCGRIGSGYDANRRGLDPRSHAGAYTASSAARLVAGVDPSPVRRSEFTDRWGVPAFATIEEMTGTVVPDLWSICTGPAAQPDIARRAMTAGARGLWCEKPIASTLGEARALVDHSRRAAVPIVVSYLRRWDQAHQAAAEWIRQDLGELQHGVVHYARGLRNYGSHALDMLRWWLGEPNWVAARPGHDSGHPDPSPVALVGFGDAVVALLPNARDTYDLFEVDIFGSRGRITLADRGRSVLVSVVGPDTDWDEPRVLGQGGPGFPVGLRDMMRSAAGDLASAVLVGSTPRCTGEDGIAALRLVEAVERSAREGTDIKLEPARADR